MHARYVNVYMFRFVDMYLDVRMYVCMCYFYGLDAEYERICMFMYADAFTYIYIHTYAHVYMIYIYTTRAGLHSGWAAYIVLCLKPEITYAIFDKVIPAYAHF